MHAPLKRTAVATLLVATAVALPAAFPAAASAAPERLLTIEIAGEGIGEVECKEGSGPAEMCEEEYPDGTKLTLVPVAEEGSKFTGFSASAGSASACTGTGTCTFTIKADTAITATFEPVPEYSLEIDLEGEGEGEVECGVGGETEQFCEAEYPAGTRVTLEPRAEEGSKFSGYSAGAGSAAACTGTTTCSFRIEANTSIGARFDYREYLLTVLTPGKGSGTVACEAQEGPEPCPEKSKYVYGTELTLRAKAAAGSEFAGWTGGCERIFGPGGSECEVEMYEAHTVRATFVVSGSGEEPPVEEEEPEEEEPEEEEGGGEEPPGGGGAGATGGGGATVSGAPAPAFPPPVPGVAIVGRTAIVRDGIAAVRLSCTGDTGCTGALELSARMPSGAGASRRRRRQGATPIGRIRFALPPGASATLRVKLSAAAVRQLARVGALQARVGGSGVAPAPVRLKSVKRTKRVR